MADVLAPFHDGCIITLKLYDFLFDCLQSIQLFFQ